MYDDSQGEQRKLWLDLEKNLAHLNLSQLHKIIRLIKRCFAVFGETFQDSRRQETGRY